GGERDRMADQEIDPSRGWLQIEVAPAYRRHQQLAKNRFSALRRIHDASQRRPVVRVHVGADGVKLESLLLDERSIEFGDGKHGPMAAPCERASQSDVRIHVAE